MKQKVIWITGVSRGLGKALAYEFASRGHLISGCARNEEQLNQITLSGGTHLLHRADVLKNEEIAAWVQESVRKVGLPDLLLNNAAVIHTPGPLWKIPQSECDAVLDVNIKGTVNVLRLAVPHMLRKGAGTIVNFSSGWGRSTDSGVSIYCATKWAIEGLTQSLAQDLPSGFTAVALNPGVIQTDMLKKCFGSDAFHYPKPEVWAKKAADFILRISASDNGRGLTVN